jgi:hypothetical protein
MPLFVLCSVLDADRLAQLKSDALLLTAAKAGEDIDDSLALSLLRDIRAVRSDGEDRLDTASLLDRLRAL